MYGVRGPFNSKELVCFNFQMMICPPHVQLVSLSSMGGEHKTGLGNNQMSDTKMSGRNPVNGRKWTNILLAANILIYVVQFALQDKLLLWGAKVNCYSINSIGPTVESFSGSTRYLAVHFVSTIASSAMSYWFSSPPALGASGAIYGLVGSVAVFVFRHRELVGGGKEDLQHIAQVIVLNMVIGLPYESIDNWGHVGGLIGGATTSWLIGPAWKQESTLRWKKNFC